MCTGKLQHFTKKDSALKQMETWVRAKNVADAWKRGTKVPQFSPWLYSQWLTLKSFFYRNIYQTYWHLYETLPEQFTRKWSCWFPRKPNSRSCRRHSSTQLWHFGSGVQAVHGSQNTTSGFNPGAVEQQGASQVNSGPYVNNIFIHSGWREKQLSSTPQSVLCCSSFHSVTARWEPAECRVRSLSPESAHVSFIAKHTQTTSCKRLKQGWEDCCTRVIKYPKL